MAVAEFFTAVKDRFTSAIGFSIAISWIIINYDFLIIVFSGAAPMEKIQLINHQVYYSFSVKMWCWFILPVISGCFYTFMYPYIDIAISSFLENKNIEKQKALMKINNTKPIAAETQFEFFEKYDAQIEAYKDRLQNVIQKRNTDVAKLSALSNLLEQKSSMRLLTLFCMGTRILPSNIKLLIEYDKGTYSEIKLNWQEDYEDFTRKKEFPHLLRLAKESLHRDVTVDDLRLVDADNITDTLGGASGAEREDYLDLVVALGLVTRYESLYNIDPLRMDGIMYIATTVAELSANQPLNGGAMNSSDLV